MRTRHVDLYLARMGFLVGLLLLAATAPPADADAPVWAVVGAPELTAALEPLIAHRRAEGFDARVLPPPAGSALEGLGRVDHVLLVGDDEQGPGEKPWRLMAPRRPFYRWRGVQPPIYAADMALGDRDGDGVPEVPVGRIPARTPEAVARVAAKIVAYERQRPTVEDLRLVTWGGAPGYGGIADRMATGLLVTVVRRGGPGWADRFLLSASAPSPFCGWPPDQPRRFGAELARGGVLGAVLAHAGFQHVFAMDHDGERVVWDLPRVREDFDGGDPAPPVVLLACDAGDFTRPAPCLGEALLFQAGGPVAVIAATTESHPLTNYYSGKALLQALTRGEAGRFGDLWLAAGREMVGMREFLIQKVLADAEGSLEEDIDIGKLKRDQLLLYALLGDPATRLRLPRPLAAQVETEGGVRRWRAQKPEGARRLVVGIRAPVSPAPPLPPAADAQTRRAALRAANAAQAYRTLQVLGSDEDWAGAVEAEGELRLAAETPSAVHVFTAP